MLSIATGYDPGYLLRTVAPGAENYYLAAVAVHGEPPGRWTGDGCEELGLQPGSEVQAPVMEALFGAWLDPRVPENLDPSTPPQQRAHLGKAPRHYKSADELKQDKLAEEPDASEERRKEIEAEAKRAVRGAAMFFDATFSVPKSVSVWHASEQAAAALAHKRGDHELAALHEKRADQIWAAIWAGNQAGLDYLQREAGYTRAGYHGRTIEGRTTGRFEDAHKWVIASFPQHDNRNGDPQLHIHNAVLNQVQRETDGEWRTLDSRGLFKHRPGAAARMERVMFEQLRARLGAAAHMRKDGKSREILGVPEEVMKFFSSRRTEVTEDLQRLINLYEGKHGKPPSARAIFYMAQHATLKTKAHKHKDKTAPAREMTLARWEQQMQAAELGALTGIPEQVAARGADAADRAAGEEMVRLAEAQLRQVIGAAVGEVSSQRAVWDRSRLEQAIERHLPDWLGGLDAQTTDQLLTELSGLATAPGNDYGVTMLNAPEVVETPAQLRRADGLSIYEPHSAARYSTHAQLDLESRIVAAAAEPGGTYIDPQRAAAALGATTAELEALAAAYRIPGRSGPGAGQAPPAELDRELAGRVFAEGLGSDQTAAVYGILTSGRAVEVITGPAGTGKSRTVGTLNHIWKDQTGGQVIGVAVSQNAANELAGQGCDDTLNTVMFFKQVGSGQLRLGPRDVVVADEASMLPDEQLLTLEQHTRRAGAKLVLTGDPEQLAAIGPGSGMRRIAAEHGYWPLTDVRRFHAEWERAASLRLRAADQGVLAEYDKHGRLHEGGWEQASAEAARAWLADYLEGRDTILTVPTNERASELAGRIRAQLAELGHVSADGITLGDEARNIAGPGDLITARENAHHLAEPSGHEVTNRDIYRIERLEPNRINPDEPLATGRRYLGRDPETGEKRWGPPVPFPGWYVKDHVELAYASTVHAAEGRTTDTSYSITDNNVDRQMLYVMLTRGRGTNQTWAITEPRAADLRPAPQARGQDQQQPSPQGLQPPEGPELTRFSVLAAAMERDDASQAATEALHGEADRATHLANIGAIWTDLGRQDTTSRYETALRSNLTEAGWQKYLKSSDGARSTLTRLVHAAELAGHDPADLAARAAAAGELDTAKDVAKVLHYRTEQLTGPALVPVETDSFTARTHGDVTSDLGRYRYQLAEAMDARREWLGQRTAEHPPAWAIEHLGSVPDDPVERQQWQQRAGWVEAYREQYGHTDERDPLGPEPGRGEAEARSLWHTAATALGIEQGQRAVRGAPAGQLWLTRARYQRELTWAPEHVADELRQATQAADAARQKATIARAHAAAAADRQSREQAEARARGQEDLARILSDRVERLTGINQVRERWHADTHATRAAAAEASAELRRRYPDADIPPLHGEHPDTTTRPQPQRPQREDSRHRQAELPLGLARKTPSGRDQQEQEAQREEPQPQAAPEQIRGQLALPFGDRAATQPHTADLQDAADAARQARHILDQRQARRERERQRGREQEHPARLARLAAQAFPHQPGTGREPPPPQRSGPERRSPRPPQRGDGPALGR